MALVIKARIGIPIVVDLHWQHLPTLGAFSVFLLGDFMASNAATLRELPTGFTQGLLFGTCVILIAVLFRKRTPWNAPPLESDECVRAKCELYEMRLKRIVYLLGRTVGQLFLGSARIKAQVVTAGAACFHADWLKVLPVRTQSVAIRALQSITTAGVFHRLAIQMGIMGEFQMTCFFNGCYSGFMPVTRLRS